MRSISSTSFSSIMVPAAIAVSFVPGFKTSIATTRPRIRSPNDSMISPPSITGVIVKPSSVPQSTSVTTRSWATSTKRRVKYPEFAVFNAVSAKPFRAPCVDIKYCSTLKPSRKLAVIGVSIMEPSGRAIKPRIPASWRIWAAEPLAPESAIMYTELKESCCTCSPWRLVTDSFDKFSIMHLAT